MHDQHIRQLLIRGGERTQPLTTFYMGSERLGHLHVVRLGVIKAIAEFVD
jgi:hypothetical protein